MLSVMNLKDFELDAKLDVIDGGPVPQSEPRVSENEAVLSNDRSDLATVMIGSEDIRLSEVDELDSSSEVIRGGGGDKGLSLDPIRSKEVQASSTLSNGASEIDVVGGVGVDSRVAVNAVRSDEERDSEADCRVIDEEMELRGSEIEFRDRNGESEHFQGNHVDGILGHGDHKVDISYGGMQRSESRPGKVHVIGKASDFYDSMLSDEFAASTPMQYGHEIGDMVWGKVKSHPWWPGLVYNEAFASPSVRRTKREGHVLVAFFGDSSYGWFDPAELIPFDTHFAEKSRQTNLRTFVKAVEEAVDEASRRHGLGLACRCRNPYNFRPTNVQGYFAVDVADYEPGAIYSENQIRKARDSFQPSRALAFIKQMALTSTVDEHPSFDFMKNRATCFAYRKAVFEEFDETYAQAFGVQPVRPLPVSVESIAQQPSRAPLSGPMVMAEALGERKISSKPIKTKDHGKKDKYLFKRRDGHNELRPNKVHSGKARSSTRPDLIGRSLAPASGDYVLQKRTPAVPVRSHIPAKHEQTEAVVKDAASTSRGLNGKAVGAVEEKPDLLKHGVVGAQTHGSRVDSAASFLVGHTKSSETYVVEAKPVLDKGKDALLELESPGCGVAAGPTGVTVSGLPDRKVIPDEVHNVPQTSELEGARPIDMKHEVHRSPGVFAVSEDLSSSEQPRDNGKGPKKAKTLKRPVSEMSSDKHNLLEKKKKRKKEFGTAEKHVITGKGETPGGEVPRKVDQGGYVPKEELWVDHLNKDDGRTSLLSDSVGSPSVAGMENAKFEFPQLLSNLQALAINPFYGTGGISPVILQHVFLRFRSLVYEKSLALLPVPEAEPSEVHAAQYPSSRDLPALKPQRTLMRPDDPTKAGRKRGPSDRQEEMATKKLKKINQLKTLTGEKKAVQKKPEVQRGDEKESSPVVHPKPVKFEPTATKKSEQGDEQELGSAVPPKPVKLDSTRKPEPPAARKSGFPAKDPTTLVMKFSPSTNLPSPSELKARLARFGPLDHLGTRVFYTSSTCRVVFLHKPDAHAAHKHLMKNKSLFGNMILRCFLREAGGPSDPESVKVRTEDGSVETPPPRESAPAASAHQQSTTQLKSCLKKSSGDETVSVAGGGVNGGSRGTPRVKFILGEEEDVKGEQLRVGNKNNKINNNATSFADGGASSSSSSHAMDVNSKNFQKVVVPPPPLPTPILVTSSSAQFPNNLYSTEVAYGKTHNVTATHSMAPPPSNTTNNVDIAPQMLSLLTRCNDVVNNVKSFLGYLPYHPL